MKETDQQGPLESGIEYRKVTESDCISAIARVDAKRGGRTMIEIAGEMIVGTVDILESMRKDKRVMRCFIEGNEILQLYEKFRPVFILLTGQEITLQDVAKKLKRRPEQIRLYFERHPDIPEAFNFILVKQ